MSNHHLTQQPILSQREAPANLTRNDSHEIMLNHRLEQTRRELIRVLDDDEAAEQRRAHTNPLTIHRRRRRTLMPSNNIAPNILLLGWSILTSLSTWKKRKSCPETPQKSSWALRVVYTATK
ncbi:hypothetical protein ACLKA7_005493 [Drosophila subpalustris]